MRSIKILTIILFSTLLVKAASAAVTISGKITEKTTGNPLEFANILLLSMPDSTYISGTATDVLQRMPGIVTENDKISVFGKGTPIVYVNNRKIRDLSELERLESSEISTVELITNPGAKYDAEGRAVLLIKTKTKINGFSAQITERLRQGFYLGNNENLNISYTHNKLNLFATYFHNYNKQRVTENHYFTLNNMDSVWHYRALMPNYWFSNNSQQVSTGFDYSLNDKHAIGGQYQYYTQNHKDIIPINTTTDLNGMPYEESYSQSYRKGNS